MPSGVPGLLMASAIVVAAIITATAITCVVGKISDKPTD